MEPEKKACKPIKILPINFNALMAGRVAGGFKTQTRRVVAEAVPEDTAEFKIMGDGRVAFPCRANGMQAGVPVAVPVTVGQLLYVREPWYCADPNFDEFKPSELPDNAPILYAADGNGGAGGKPRLARFMPKKFARTFLRVTGVRCERLCGTSEADAVAEGATADCAVGYIPAHSAGPHAYCFASLWESIFGAGSWDANPWVWVYKFEVVDMPWNPWNLSHEIPVPDFGAYTWFHPSWYGVIHWSVDVVGGEFKWRINFGARIKWSDGFTNRADCVHDLRRFLRNSIFNPTILF